MISNKTIFVSGAGGFIGGHLIKKLLENKNKIVAADIKPIEINMYLHTLNNSRRPPRRKPTRESAEPILHLHQIQ